MIEAHHPNSGIELAEFNAGRRAHPPCANCAGPVDDGGISGAFVCAECEEGPLRLGIAKTPSGVTNCDRCGRFVAFRDARYSHEFGDYGTILSTEVFCKECA